MGREQLSEIQQKQMQNSVPREENHLYQHGLGADLLGNSSVEKDLGALVDTELSMGQQCDLGAPVVS